MTCRCRCGPSCRNGCGKNACLLFRSGYSRHRPVHAQGAPLDIRVNTLLAKRDDVLQLLHDKNIEAAATPYSPVGIRLKEKIPLNKDALFTEGKIEVQDEGSQLLGFLLAPKRNDMVVDFCAGAGGKTLMLSALMNSQGRLYAMDTSEKRLANLKPRLKRSGASNIQPMLIAHENDLKVKRLSGKIDRVLVDAHAAAWARCAAARI